MGTDGGPLHRLIPRLTHHPECAQAIRASQHEITGKAGPCPRRGSHHLWKVCIVGRFSSQFIDDMQEVRKSLNILLEPAVGLSLPRKLTGEGPREGNNRYGWEAPTYYSYKLKS